MGFNLGSQTGTPWRSPFYWYFVTSDLARHCKRHALTLVLGQDLDLRHADPRMVRGDHDLRVPPAAPMAVGGIGLPPTMQQQPPARPAQTMPEMDS